MNDGKNAKRLFVDMDGTLAVFNPAKKIEDLYERGYFSNLEPMKNVIDSIRRIIQTQENVDVYILSAVLSDSKYALIEKNEWLDKHLPEINREHRIFPPCGTDKKEYIPQGISSADILLDDYTVNLLSWQPPGKGIKLLNGINDTHATWQGVRVSADEDIMNSLIQHLSKSSISEKIADATERSATSSRNVVNRNEELSHDK